MTTAFLVLFYLIGVAGFAAVACLCLKHSPFTRTFIAERLLSTGFHPELEGLRGLLAISVALYHFYLTYRAVLGDPWQVPEDSFGAFVGPRSVSFFFMITGFLFWSKVLNRGGRLGSLRVFFMARVKRLMPAYLGSLALIFLVVAVQSGFELRRPPRELATEVAKWVFVGLPASGFPDVNGAAQTWLINGGVFWSIRIELLFYFALPLMAVFARGQRPVALVTVIGLLALLPSPSLQTVAGLPTVIVRAINLALNVAGELSRHILHGFGYGMLAAVINAAFAKRAAPRPRFGALASLLLVVCAAFAQRVGMIIGCEALLFFAFLPIVLRFSGFSILHWRGFSLLGAVSYSLYLCHGIVIFCLTRGLVGALAPRFGIEAAFMLAIIPSFVAVFSLAYGLWRLCEYPNIVVSSRRRELTSVQPGLQEPEVDRAS